MGKIVLLTGRPGIGKTTALKKIIDMLKARGWSVGGMISSEICRSDRRVGFGILDIMSGKSGTLAHIGFSRGPQVGIYRVNLEDLEHIGVQAILKALEEVEIVCCDEIAPMELSSLLFRECIKKVIESPKPFVATIHRNIRDPFLQEIKARPNIEVLEVSEQNRDRIPFEVVRLIESNLNLR